MTAAASTSTATEPRTAKTLPTGTRHLLMVAFGGPEAGCCKTFETCPGEAYCFVSGIFGHNEARKKRIDEVTQHYRDLGGFSKFNDLTRNQARALEKELARRGYPFSVRVGFHHWAPYARHTIAEMKQDGVKDFMVLVMAPHQSTVSWDHYLRIVGEGVQQAGEGAPTVSAVIDPWWNKAGFVGAIAARIRDAAAASRIPLNDKSTGVLLTAHAIPQAVARSSAYCQQFEETAALVAKSLGVANAKIAYQSQPGDSKIPWTSPSIEKALEELKHVGVKNVVAAAIGFLCDNVEVLHDLGVEGADEAKKLGLNFVRAESVHDHPEFIGMLADQVLAKTGG